jgi:hypothetical protein
VSILSVREAFAIDTNGVTRIFHYGDLVDSGDPVVKGRESLFVPAEGTLNTGTQRVAATATVIEAATAEPGHKRTRSVPESRA